VRYAAEFYGRISRDDVKGAVHTLLAELYFSTEFERDNGENWYTVEDNETYTAHADYRFCDSSRVCHVRIVAENKQILASLAQTFASSADEYFDYWYCIADTVGSQHSDRSFSNIHAIENMLRAYVFKKLVMAHGADWEEHLGLEPSRIAGARKLRSRAADVGAGEYLAKLNILFYLEFHDVIQLLERATDNNDPPGELFAEALVRQQLDELNDLRAIRNDIAHNRFLTEAAFQRVNRQTTAARRALEEDTKRLVSL